MNVAEKNLKLAQEELCAVKTFAGLTLLGGGLSAFWFLNDLPSYGTAQLLGTGVLALLTVASAAKLEARKRFARTPSPLKRARIL